MNRIPSASPCLRTALSPPNEAPMSFSVLTFPFRDFQIFPVAGGETEAHKGHKVTRQVKASGQRWDLEPRLYDSKSWTFIH